MDRRTLVAIAICILFLLFYPQILRLAGLGRYIEPQRHTTTAPADTAGRASGPAAPREGAAPEARTPAPAAGAVAGDAAPELPPVATPAAPERLIRVGTPLYDATFSTRGARLVSTTLKRYAMAHALTGRGHVHKDKSGDYPEEARVTLAGGPTFGLDLGSGDHLMSLAGADYAAAESLDAAGAIRALTFTLRDTSGLLVRQT